MEPDDLYFLQTSTIIPCPIQSSPLRHISLSSLCYHLYLDLQRNSASCVSVTKLLIFFPILYILHVTSPTHAMKPAVFGNGSNC